MVPTSFSQLANVLLLFSISGMMLMAVAADAVIMSRLRNLWARSELQVESEADEDHKPEESAHVA